MIVAPPVENQIAPRKKDRQTDSGIGKERKKGSEKCVVKKEKATHETYRSKWGGRGRVRDEKKLGEREKETHRAARLAGNYMAFVSDGAFNDLSTSKFVFDSSNHSARPYPA